MSKINPRKIKVPFIQNWCYDPKELSTPTTTTTTTTTSKTPISAKGFITTGSTSRLYQPSTNSYCELPSLPSSRSKHSVTGLTVCGGEEENDNTCVTLNSDSGKWETSYELASRLYGHVAWQTSKGILLMGGSDGSTEYLQDSIKTETTLLLPGGQTQPGPFELRLASYQSCAIEDPRSNSVIITGGWRLGWRETVDRYNEEGFVESLPNLNHARMNHGCAGYYNDNNKLV